MVNFIKSILSVLIALIIITFPNLFFLYLNGQGLRLMLSWEGLSITFLFSFLFLFFWNIKIYFKSLYLFVFFVPFICYSIYLYNLNLSPELIRLVMQTSFREARELVSGYVFGYVVILVLLTLLYFLLVRNIHIKRIPFLPALFLSLLCAALFWGKIFQLKKTFKVNSLYGILNQYYPVSFISTILQTATVKRNSLAQSENFHFYPYSLAKLPVRQVYVLIIGESSRYDHWHINGYLRATSPSLDTIGNLISFHNVFSGAYFTYLSVPQMITRASPGSMDKQFKEKSILSIYKDLGFKTIWISNQDEDYYTGSFTLHAETADLHIFPDDHILPDVRNRYDEKYLPIIDSLLHASIQNIFLVFHTLGSHWNYADRYPPKFDFFQPSGKNINILKPNPRLKNVIINSYDNSVLYTDYIISSIIHEVNNLNSISFVCYISDHGEDLFDKDSTKLLFHLYPSYQTLHIPLFIWTSSIYNKFFPDKRMYLEKRKDSLIRSNDIFYTMLGMSNIKFSGFDSTSDFSSPYFRCYPIYYTDDGKDKILLKSK